VARVIGSVDPAFNAVRTAFQHNFELGAERDAQLVIRQHGQKVVDLVGKSTETYSNRTIQQVFSSGKMIESLAILIAVDKGWVDFEDPVAKHWPSFATNGKGHVTIAEVMQHDAGLPAFKEPVTERIMEAYTNGDPNPLAQLIEQSEPIVFADQPHRRMYHGFTRGWIVGEIIRHADPQHRLFHHFVRDEILAPLHVDLHWPTPPEILANPLRYSPQHPASKLWAFANIGIPYVCKGKVPGIPPLDDPLLERMIDHMTGPNRHYMGPLGRAVRLSSTIIEGIFESSDFDTDDMRSLACGTSFGVRASGEALGIIAELFLHRGLSRERGVRLVSEATFAKGSVPSSGVWFSCIASYCSIITRLQIF